MLAATFRYSEEGIGWGRSSQALLAVPKCNSPPVNGQCTNFTLSDVALLLHVCPKGLKPVLTHDYGQVSSRGMSRVINDKQANDNEYVILTFSFSWKQREVTCSASAEVSGACKSISIDACFKAA